MNKADIKAGDLVTWVRAVRNGTTEMIPATVVKVRPMRVRIDAEDVGVRYVDPQNLMPREW